MRRPAVYRINVSKYDNCQNQYSICNRDINKKADTVMKNCLFKNRPSIKISASVYKNCELEKKQYTLTHHDVCKNQKERCIFNKLL